MFLWKESMKCGQVKIVFSSSIKEAQRFNFYLTTSILIFTTELTIYWVYIDFYSTRKNYCNRKNFTTALFQSNGVFFNRKLKKKFFTFVFN